MRIVRLVVVGALAVAVGGAGYFYRDQVAQRLGFGTAANAAEKGGASPAASAQPQGRRGRANPGGPVPVVVTKVDKKPMPVVMALTGVAVQVKSGRGGILSAESR